MDCVARNGGADGGSLVMGTCLVAGCGLDGVGAASPRVFEDWLVQEFRLLGCGSGSGCVCIMLGAAGATSPKAHPVQRPKLKQAKEPYTYP